MRLSPAAALEVAGVAAAGDARIGRVEVGGVRLAVTALALGDAALDLSRPDAADVWLVSLHTTGPPSYLPGPRLRAAVERSVDAGADVVVAHGSHVLGPVTWRGRTLVAWGLGNLTFHCECTREDESLVLELRLDARGVREAAVRPVRAGLTGPARPAPDPEAIYDLLEALGTGPLQRAGPRAVLLPPGERQVIRRPRTTLLRPCAPSRSAGRRARSPRCG